MLYEFREKLFLEYKKWWFVWEPAWEGFRPIDSVVWDGQTFQLDDKAYCADPTDPLYGYGSEQMRDICEILTQRNTGTPTKVSTLPLGTEWFRDRFVSLSPCASRDAASWKRMVQNHGRTCRTAPRGKKLTRRIRL